MNTDIQFEIDEETGKPVVWYTGVPEFHVGQMEDGSRFEYARVRAANHPRLGTGDIRTSRVIRKFHLGFETKNTIYQFDDSGLGG